jgi:hypothetical protein
MLRAALVRPRKVWVSGNILFGLIWQNDKTKGLAGRREKEIQSIVLDQGMRKCSSSSIQKS